MRGLTLLLSVVLVGCLAGTTDQAPSQAETPTAGPAPTTTFAEVTTTVTLLPGTDPILGVVPPEPTDYPFVEYSYRWFEYIAECGEAAGLTFRVIDTAAPHMIQDGPDSPRWPLVKDRCELIAQQREWAIPDPFDGSAEANALLYGIFVDIHDCMVENGYPTTDPPSEDAFIAEGEALWTPWEEMFNSVFYGDPDEQMSSSGRLQYEAQETCGGLPNEVYDEQLQEQGG